MEVYQRAWGAADRGASHGPPALKAVRSCRSLPGGSGSQSAAMTTLRAAESGEPPVPPGRGQRRAIAFALSREKSASAGLFFAGP